MSEKFKIGDRVVLIDDHDNKGKKGMIGVIRGVEEEGINCYQIEFPEGFDGHSCGGLVDDKRGWNVVCDKVELTKDFDSVFKVGVRVKLEYYAEFSDHERHEGQSAIVISVESSSIRIKWEDESTSTVDLRNKSNPYVVNDELKNNKMDINEIKKLDKDVLKQAKANVLKARKESQVEQATEVLTDMFSFKDSIEEKIGIDQEALNEVVEDIKVFDVKR